jgi:hypothetical protein
VKTSHRGVRIILGVKHGTENKAEDNGLAYHTVTWNGNEIRENVMLRKEVLWSGEKDRDYSVPDCVSKKKI